MRYGKFWIALAVVLVASFAVLLYFGREIYLKAPPIPQRVVTTDGRVLFTGSDILDGQNVWQSMGGQQIGTVWGHGAYVAPDWSADWLHREAIWTLDYWANQQYHQPYNKLTAEEQAPLKVRLQTELRANTYNPKTGDLVVSPLRAQAIAAVADHYIRLFGTDPALDQLRKDYAIPTDVLPDPTRRPKLADFYFWTSWACVTDRPGTDISYTHNWPADDLVGNHPTGSLIIWSLVSIVLLIAGIGALAWYHVAESHHDHTLPTPPARDPFLGLTLTPSMKATLKYFWVVTALFLVQIGTGALTAHYGVEGQGFFGIPLAQYLPYAVTRTWHLQLAIFWIATAWLATGLFIAPAVSGYEPKYQRLGVHILFLALLVIVVGSMAGEWFSIEQKMGLTAGFWFGDQGYEYVDLGRFWQIFLFAGLFIWLGLMVRALWPAFKKPGENKHLLSLFVLASAAIGIFYGAGLMWGSRTHLAVAEFWRWWVVHLWVEGFFEVFATVAMAFLYTKLGLVKPASATRNVLFATVIFLSGGIIGTFHHLYFSGTPTAVMAFGAVFSALEVVPLTLMGFDAYENIKHLRSSTWIQAYKWPILFFIGVAFWNMVGAGVFGFLINPPIALYYMQGLNTTPVHAHTALFGVYGLLGLGLMLFCLKGLSQQRPWKTTWLAYSFWAMNIGLVLMVVLSLLPVGLAQTYASIHHGMWYARSAEFMQAPVLQHLRWMRIFGDTVFSTGALALAWFVAGLHFGWSYQPDTAAQPSAPRAGQVLEPTA